MGVPLNKPLECRVCGEDEETKLKKDVKAKSGRARICTKCDYLRRKEISELESGGGTELIDTEVQCHNKCNNYFFVKHEKGTKPPPMLCYTCKKRSDGTIDNCGLANNWAFD